MNDNPKDAKGGETGKVRTAFPEVCKWFAENGGTEAKEAVSEVGKRFQRFKESGISPCEGCPLCQHH